MIFRNPVYFALFFVGVWVGVGYLISLITGWRQLAQFYRFSGEFDGQLWKWQSAQTRWTTHYGNCLTVGANRQGLYLAVLWLFRAGHPPLLIPWSDISAVKGETLWFGYTEFRFPQAPWARLRFSERLSQRIVAAAGGAWSGPATPAGPLAV